MTKKEIAFEERMAKQRTKRGFCDRDVWSIDYWFCETIAPMLRKLAKTKHGCPCIDENGDVFYKENISDEELETYSKRWDDILLHMAFLADEMHPEKCSMKNPYDKQLVRFRRNFKKKYGNFGEKLYTEEDKKEIAEKGTYRMYTASDDPIHGEEYNKISELHTEYERVIYEYMEKSKDEFFTLFRKYFRDLWD